MFGPKAEMINLSPADLGVRDDRLNVLPVRLASLQRVQSEKGIAVAEEKVAGDFPRQIEPGKVVRAHNLSQAVGNISAAY